MRWSPSLCLFLILTIITTAIDGTLARPTPAANAPERHVRRAKPPSGKGPALKAGDVKQSSSTYRKAALQNPTTYTQQKGKIVKVPTSKAAARGKDAGVVLSLVSHCANCVLMVT